MSIRLFQGLRGVRRADLPGEILAGVTLAALMIPLNIGYAQVAGLPAIVGLYASIFPMIAFAVFCSSRQLVAGPDAPISALIATLLAALALPGDPRYVQLAYAQALVCSGILFAFWYFRLGFLANFLSKAVLVGFVSGLGIEVFTSQIEKIMGISLEAEEWVLEVFEMIRRIPETNLYTLAVGVGSVAIIRLLKRYLPAVPGPLVALALMTALVAIFGLDQRGVSVLGPVPSGLPTFVIPEVRPIEYLKLFPGALAICGITLAEGLLVARSYARKNGYPLDANTEIFAFGAANVAAGLTGSMAVGSSASRTAAMDSVGTRSQVPLVVGAIVVAIVLMFFTDLLALLPNAALAGIVANAVLGLIEVDELRELYRLRVSEFSIAAVCLASVLVFGALPAVVLAFLLTAIEMVRRESNPDTYVLAEGPDGNSFFTTERHQDPQVVPGLVVYRFGAPLFFANANLLQEEIEQLVETADPPLEWLVLDAEAISDIDVTGADTLHQVVDFLRGSQVMLVLSRVSPIIRALLERYELLEQIGEVHIYDSNHAARDAYLRRHLSADSRAATVEP